MTRHWLLDRLGEYAQRRAVVWHDQPSSYAQLLDTVSHWERALTANGVSSGTCVAIVGDYVPATFGLLLALIQRGAIVVPLSGTSNTAHERQLEIAKVQVVCHVEASGAGRWQHREASACHPLLDQLRSIGEPGLVLFSSGSTGAPKAVLHDFNRLLAKFQSRRRAYCTLAFLALDHIGGINTLFHALSHGGTVVIAREKTPESVCATIERHRVELLPTSPTFLNLLLVSCAYRRHDLSSLQLITYGTEPMPASTLARIRQVLPQVELKQTYGLSELGILQTRSRDPSSLWMMVGGSGFETKVVDGRLWIRAASAMLGYLNAPSPFDAGGWFNTEDLVERDGDYLRVLGRSSELINVGGQKVYPAEVESLLLEADNVRDVVVRGEPNPITGQMVVATLSLAQPEDSHQLRQRLRAFCQGKLEPYKIPVRFEVREVSLSGGRFKRVRQRTSPGCPA